MSYLIDSLFLFHKKTDDQKAWHSEALGLLSACAYYSGGLNEDKNVRVQSG